MIDAIASFLLEMSFIAIALVVLVGVTSYIAARRSRRDDDE